MVMLFGFNWEVGVFVLPMVFVRNQIFELNLGFWMLLFDFCYCVELC